MECASALETLLPAYDEAVNRARQTLFRFTAAALADPRTGACTLLFEPATAAFVAEAAALLRDEPDFIPAHLARGEGPLANLNPAAIFHQRPESPAALNGLFEQSFGLVAAGTCPPYETEFVPSKLDFQRSNALADIAGYYQAFGVEPSATQPERHDHIVLELEFMATLVALERLAAHGPTANAERMFVCREAQARFLREHLAWWAPAFARLLGAQAPGEFYSAVATFLAALIGAERAYLGVPAPDDPLPLPTVIERPEECTGCELAVQ